MHSLQHQRLLWYWCLTGLDRAPTLDFPLLKVRVCGFVLRFIHNAVHEECAWASESDLHAAGSPGVPGSRSHTLSSAYCSQSQGRTEEQVWPRNRLSCAASGLIMFHIDGVRPCTFSARLETLWVLSCAYLYNEILNWHRGIRDVLEKHTERNC